MSAFASGGGESVYINNKPNSPAEFIQVRSQMLEIITKETRHVGIFLSFFESFVVNEHTYIGFSAIEYIVERFNAKFFDEGAMILLNVNGNKYTGDVNIVEMKLVLQNNVIPDGMAESITTFEQMCNAAAEKANKYISTQEKNPHVTSKDTDVDCYVPIIADDSTQQIVRMSPLEYEAGTIYSGDTTDFTIIDAKYKISENKKCVPKFLFNKSYTDPNNSNKTKLYRSCGYVFDNAGKQFQLFMFNYNSQTLPFVYLFDTLGEKYVAVKIQKNNDKPSADTNAYTINSYDGEKLFDMDLIPMSMAGDLSSVASSAQSSNVSSRSISRNGSFDSRLHAPPALNVTNMYSWKIFEHEDTKEIMKLVYPDEDEEEEDEEASEEEVREAFIDLLQFATEKTIPLPTFPGCAFGCFVRLNVLHISQTDPVSFFTLFKQAYLEFPELVCRYIFQYGDFKNFYLNADLSEFDENYTLEQKQQVLTCLIYMNILNKGNIDAFFVEYISKQKFDLLKGEPCIHIRIGNETEYFDVPMKMPLDQILIFVPKSLSIIIGNEPIQNVKNGLIAITNGEKQFEPPSLETVDELFKDSLYSLFRTPQKDVPCLFDIFGNMCNNINKTFSGLAYAIIAGGGPFALLGTGKIADVDCMIITTETYLYSVKQFLVDKIIDIMHFINTNLNLYFPGPFEFYLSETHFYRVVFKGCKGRIHGDNAKIKRLHSLDLIFDYYEFVTIDGAQTAIGNFEKGFAALDVVIKVFTGDDTGDIWDKVTTDLPTFAAKYINLGYDSSFYPAWNISGMLLALISTLDPDTINPNMRELVGKLINECKRPKFVLDLLQAYDVTTPELNGIIPELNETLTKLIKSGTVTADTMREYKIYEMLLVLVNYLPIDEISNMMFIAHIQLKLVITNQTGTPTIDYATPGFGSQRKKNDVVIIFMDGGKDTKGAAIGSIMGENIGDYNLAKSAHQPSVDVEEKPGGGGHASTTLYFYNNNGNPPVKVIHFTKQNKPHNTYYKNGTFKFVDEHGNETSYVDGGARRTRRRTNKPMKTRKRRSTRKRRPRKTIRK